MGVACCSMNLQLDGSSLLLNESSNDLEIPLELPIGDGVEPLAPLPFAGGGEMLDEVGSEPVARGLRGVEDAGGLDERARRPRHVVGAGVVASRGFARELEVPFHALEAGRDR